MTISGAIYTVFASGTLWRSQRLTADAWQARWVPIVISTIDFGFLAIQGLLALRTGHPFSAGQPALASAIVMSFSIARSQVFHVAYSGVLALVSFSIVTAAAGELATSPSLFILGGLALVLAFMIALTNIAVAPDVAASCASAITSRGSCRGRWRSA